MSYFEIKNLTKNFGNKEVLKGIDLTLEKGQVLSIIGSSGSGKTTLLRCINFLETATSGSMTVDGEQLFNGSYAKEKEKDLRRKRLNFGLVFQSFNLFPQYTVLKNVTLAPTLLLKENFKAFKKQEKNRTVRAKVLNERKAQINQEAEDLLQVVGLTEKANEYPCTLSGGQCQRVAIARALALKPKILCFDEPTSALDPELTGEVLKVIRSLKSEDRTMIIVTHEMAFAKNVSDKVVFMADGIVEEVGTPEEIFENPKSEKLINFLANTKESDESEK